MTSIPSANIEEFKACGTLIEGFATLIGKSFATTGRVFNREEQDSVMAVWRHAGHVMPDDPPPM